MTNFVKNNVVRTHHTKHPKYLELDDKQDREELDAILTKLYQKLSGGGIVFPVNRMQATIIETFAKTMIDEDWSCETKT